MQVGKNVTSCEAHSASSQGHSSLWYSHLPTLPFTQLEMRWGNAENINLTHFVQAVRGRSHISKPSQLSWSSLAHPVNIITLSRVQESDFDTLGKCRPVSQGSRKVPDYLPVFSV